MNDETHQPRRKFFVIALLGLFIGLLAFSLADQALNQEIAFEVVINNTNLAPNVAGHPPGTGERISGTAYFANTSAIQLFVFSHANTAGQNGQISLNINDTEVLNTAIRPIGVAENTNTTLSAIIPRYSKYIVNFSNYHHYEWREYPILSGRNGTLSINQTIIQSGGSGGVSFNGNPVNLNGSSFFNGSITNLSNNIDMLGFGLLNSSTNLTTPGGTYYVGKNGTDTISCGNSSNPCLTIGYFVSKLYAKPVLLGNVTLHIYSGEYTENIDVSGIYPGNYRLTFEGEYRIIDSLIVSTARAGSAISQADFTNTTSMTMIIDPNKS